MSRLASQEKGLYYPTPEPIISYIVQRLSSRYPSGNSDEEIRVLDPCVGKGRAVALFAEEYRAHMRKLWYYSHTFPTITTYGIEPNIARVKQARKVVDDVLHASFFQSLMSNGDSVDGGFQLAFVNPPYDFDSENKGERLEISFLKRVTQKLCFNGVLVWIVPQWLVERGASYLSRHYTDVRVYRFPDDDFATPEMIEAGQSPVPMFSLFKQVVVMASKGYGDRHDPITEKELTAIGTSDNPQEDIAPLTALDPLERRGDYGKFSVPLAKAPLKYWSPSKFDPDEAASLLAVPQGNTMPTNGVYSKLQYQSQHWPTEESRNLSIGRPLAPLKRAFIALLSVAGMINGSSLKGKDGREVIVKGFSRKRAVTSITEDEENIITTKKDIFDTALWCIDMTPGDNLGQLIRIEAGSATSGLNVSHETMTLGDFLDNFGVSLASKMAANNPALYNGPMQVPWANNAFAQMKRQPLGRQRDSILSIVNAMAVGGGTEWPRMNRVGEIAEMATGKTYLSLATMFLGDAYLNGCEDALPEKVKPLHLSPAVVMCPEIIAYKWAREAEITLPQVKTIVIQRVDTPEKARELRRFDPEWKGEKVSAVGCIEIVIKRIQCELESWQYDYDQAKKHSLPMPRKPAHVVVIPNNTAKLGMVWTPVYRLSTIKTKDAYGKVTVQRDEVTKLPRLLPCCPSCFAPVKDQTRIEKLMKERPEYKRVKQQLDRARRNGKAITAIDEESMEDEGAYVTEEELWGSADKHKKHWCGKCGGSLWQMTSEKSWSPRTTLRGDEVTSLPLPRDLNSLPMSIKDTSYRRYSVADYIRKFHSGFFKLLISDEIHQGKEGTAIDFARRALMGSCGNYLGLTGTLCNGYASSLFPFAWSINPTVREQFAYDGMRAWVDRYGARKTVTKQPKDDGSSGDGAISKRKTGGKPVESELPAFAPSGLPAMLAKAAFLELADVAPCLPPYSEEVDIIPLEGELEDAYREFESTITMELAARLVLGDKRALGSWFQCLRRYPNMPYTDCICHIKKTGEVLGTAPKLTEDMIYPKEQRIIDLVTSELEQGRRVIIYAEETGEYDIQPRYKKLIEANVKPRNGDAPNVAILKSGKTLEREATLKKYVDGGCNVLICNSALVQVGLDLIDFHTIIVPSIMTSTSQMRQSYRRINRPGQTKSTKIIMLVYPTMELRLLRLMSNKMKTALMVEGQLPNEGLVSFNEGDTDTDGDFQIALARQVQAALEQGQASVVDVMREAEELQQQFKDAEEASRRQNEYIGIEEEISEIPLANIVTEELQGSTDQMVIIPVMTTQDPWAALRAKRDALKRQRRVKKTANEVQGSLW
jgi:Uncharacterised methyltransferase family (DUF6094)